MSEREEIRPNSLRRSYRAGRDFLRVPLAETKKAMFRKSSFGRARENTAAHSRDAISFIFRAALR